MNSVIIDNFDLLGISAGPTETDAPLIIYPNRVLPAATTFECLPSMAGRQLEESQLHGSINQL